MKGFVNIVYYLVCVARSGELSLNKLRIYRMTINIPCSLNIFIQKSTIRNT